MDWNDAFVCHALGKAVMQRYATQEMKNLTFRFQIGIGYDYKAVVNIFNKEVLVW